MWDVEEEAEDTSESDEDAEPYCSAGIVRESLGCAVAGICTECFEASRESRETERRVRSLRRFG